MSKLERITHVKLPYDLRDPDPKKDYGISGLQTWFVLKGPKGAVQFAVYFPLYLPHVEKRDVPRWTHMHDRDPRGHDVGYHSAAPMYDGQRVMDTECQYVDSGKCYYDGSSLRADEWAQEIFAIRGEQPEKEIWRRLEAEYAERFGAA